MRLAGTDKVPRDTFPHALPSDLEAEQAILGAILYDPNSLILTGNLKSDDFYEPFHQRLFHVISTKIAHHELADPVTLLPDFESDQAFQELGGVQYLGLLYDRAPPSSSAPSYAQVIRDYSRRRKLAQIGDTLATAALDNDTPLTLRAQQDLALLARESAPFALSPLTVPDPETIPPREWLYGRHLIRGYVSTTIAPGGLGKSSMVMTEAIAMACGKRLLNERVSHPLRVFYWNGEDPQDELNRRFAAIMRWYSISNQDLQNRLFSMSGRDHPINLASYGYEGVILNETLITQLIAQIRHANIDVFVVDPFVSTHTAPENDNGAIDAIVKRGLARIAHETSCAVEIVHHVRKPGSGAQTETSVDDARGASALIGAVRSARVLNVMDKETASQVGVENRYSYFRVDNGKSNLAPRSDAAIWRKIESVDLRNGQPSDEIGVVTPWEVPGLYQNISVDHVREIQSRAAQSDYRKDKRAPDWIGHMIGAVLAIDSDDDKISPRISKMVDGWLKSGLLEIVEKTDPSTRKKRDFVTAGKPIDEVDA